MSGYVEAVKDIMQTLRDRSAAYERLTAENAALRKRVEELEGALEPFDEAFGFMLEGTDDYQSEEPVTVTCGRNTTHFLLLGNFRRARAALRAKGGEHGE